MDINDFRGALTAVMLLLFLVLCGWLWLARSKADFDEAASLPLLDDEAPSGVTGNSKEAKQ